MLILQQFPNLTKDQLPKVLSITSCADFLGADYIKFLSPHNELKMAFLRRTSDFCSELYITSYLSWNLPTMHILLHKFTLIWHHVFSPCTQCIAISAQLLWNPPQVQNTTLLKYKFSQTLDIGLDESTNWRFIRIKMKKRLDQPKIKQ
jgi:hypothetical protein